MRYFYRCSECDQEYVISPDIMLCPACSEKQEEDQPLRGILEVGFSGRLPENFVPVDFLPVDKKYFPPIPVGNTPLWEPQRLRDKNAFANLYIKDDSLNPTGSLKDRASYLVAAFAVMHNIKDVVLASTGNAGSSMAGVGASAGLNIMLFLPKAAPPAKMVQALQYGATLNRVDGTYDLAFKQSMDYSKNHGGLNRNTAYNPMTIEGKKTVSLEIFQQLGDTSPDYVFVSVGDGVILGGLYKGFHDLLTLGFIDKIPIIYAVQSEGSAAIYRAVQNNYQFAKPVAAKTIADSISVDVPANGYYACKYLKKHNGQSITVTDNEIINAQLELSSQAGCFAEPAAATAYAGFVKAKDDIPEQSSVVLLITGNGLKDINTAMKGINL